MSSKIVVVGSANIDMVVKSDQFPDPGETILGGDFFMNPGGKGANQAVAAARLGGEVHFMCRVGDDDFGKRSIKGYKNEGIITDHIVVDPERPTGVALISVNGDGENKIIVAPGANKGFTEQEIEKAYALFSGADLIILQLEIPLQAVGQIIKIAKKNNTKVILNTAPAQSLPEWFYEDLFVITPNKTEAQQLTGITINGEDDVVKASESFHNAGVKNVIITMGGEGAFISSPDYTGLLAPPEVDVQDTTAAGDVFNGALAVSLTNKKSWEEAVNLACNAAALSVSKIGAQSSSPTVEELRDFAASSPENA